MSNTVTHGQREADLLPYCPGANREIWSSHPRVFLAIKNKLDATVTCPYCGTRYRLNRGD